MQALEEEKGICQNPWTIHAIRLLLLTGCRLSEILTLTWNEVDFDNQCLRLQDIKTGKKLVYLSSPALEVFRMIPRITDNPYVICGDKEGSHLINLQKPWQRVCARVGLEDLRLHDLRHTFASIAACNGLYRFPSSGRVAWSQASPDNGTLCPFNWSTIAGSDGKNLRTYSGKQEKGAIDRCFNEGYH